MNGMAKSLIVLAGKKEFILPEDYKKFDILKCSSIFDGATQKLDNELNNKKLYKSILVINTDHIECFEGSEEVFLSYFINSGNFNKFTLYTTRFHKTPYRYTDDTILNEIVIPSPYLYMCDSLTFNVLSSYREEILNYEHDYRFKVKFKPIMDDFDPIHFSFFNVLSSMNIDIETV